MPPTDSERDSNPSSPDDKDENPFIKFKRFADAQIGAVLQGIIGLPSVFSKQLHDANSRWADLHDDLRRRDRLLAEQRASDAPGSTHNHADSEDDKAEIPVKKFPGWSLSSLAQAESLGRPSVDDRYCGQDRIDLFSPVTKSLFTHLIRNPVDDVDWSKLGLLPKYLQIFPGSCLNSSDFFNLRDNQKTGNSLNIIQSMVFNNINRTARTVGYNQLHSPQSVLPYILFSPYSPLALSSMPFPSKRSSVFEHEEDDFPYCEAFEDLLLASQGRPMARWVLIPPELRANKDSSAANEFQDGELGKARIGMFWIDNLHTYGLLTKDPPSNFPLLGPMEHSSPIRMKFAKANWNGEESIFAKSKSQRGPDTEQDLYDLIERIVGNTSSPFPGRDAAKMMEAFIEEAASSLAEQENNPASSRPLSAERGSSKAVDARSAEDGSGIMRQLGFTGSKSTSTQTEVFHDQVAQAGATRSAESDQTEDAQLRADVPSGAERVISTTTSTEQTTERGMVHTTCTIKKIYADGSTLVTKTSNASSPPISPQVVQKLSTDDRCEYGDAKFDDEEEPPKSKEKRSKGWFWN